MSNGPWACVRCGSLIRERLPARGLAHRFDPRPYCSGCLRTGTLFPTPTQPVVPFAPSPVLRRSG